MYDAYPAAGSRDQKDKPLMSKLNREVAYVSSAVGGSLSQISFGGSEVRSRVATNYSGGIKEKIRGFTRESRRNLLRKLASINRGAFRAHKGRLISVGLTYPSEYPEDPMLCKRHLEALRKRLERAYGDFSAFWRLGIQQRGAWHFHLLLFVPPSFGSVGELRDFIASSWYEICGKLCEGHLLAGTHVEEVRNWKSATSYTEKYVAKPERSSRGYRRAGYGGPGTESCSQSSGRR
jgi:hypothetical protein